MAKSTKPARWIAAGHSVNVQGYEVKGGLFYIGEPFSEGRYIARDAGVINPRLKVLPGDPRRQTDGLGYRPRYNFISPECRGAYLKWLADGRSDPEAVIEYVFMFFNGLERRLLVDGLGKETSVTACERAEIVREANRLLEIYAEHRYFSYAARCLTVMEWIIYQRDKPVPDYLDLSSDHCEDAFRVVLAKHAKEKKPIPPDVALQWMKLQPDYQPKAAARRCSDLFDELFSRRYRQTYGDGLVVKPNKPVLKIEYYTGYSSALDGEVFEVPELRDTFRLSQPLKKIGAIMDICAKDLNSYSRFVRNQESQKNSLAALALLPEDLLAQSEVVGKAKTRLSQLCATDAGLVAVEGLYACFGEKPPKTIRDRDARNLAALVEGAGFGLAPDIRFHNIKPDPDGKAALFADGHGMHFVASGEYLRVGATLQLGAMMGQIDGNVSRPAEAILRSQVTENGLLTWTERNSLMALLEWCLVTPQSSSGVRKRLAGMDRDGIAAIRHALVLVAVADGRISPSKIKHLEKFYQILGLDKGRVSNDLHALATRDEPAAADLRDPGLSLPHPASHTLFSDKQYQAARPHFEKAMNSLLAKGHGRAEAIGLLARIMERILGAKTDDYLMFWVEHEFLPAFNKRRKRVAKGDAVTTKERNAPEAASVQAGGGKGFSIDEALLHRRTEETRLAREVLEEIFDEREDEHSAENITANISPSGNPLNSLDKAHQDLFHRLIQHEAWERSGIQQQCEKLGLMLDGAMEKLNEWFFDHAGEPLIEDGDPVWINVESARELSAARQQQAATGSPGP